MRTRRRQRQQVLLLGGRSGVGKTAVGHEVADQLEAAGVAHCHLDGDALDDVRPKPATDPHGTALTEANLAAVWANTAAAGYARLVYVNTASVLERDLVVRAMGGAVDVTAVLLTADDATAEARLRGRELGSALQRHLQRSAAMAALLDAEAPPWVLRVPTDGRGVVELAADVVRATGWAPAGG